MSLSHLCPLLTCSLHRHSLRSQTLQHGFLQAEQHDSEQGDEGKAKPNGQEAGMKLPPYTLKVANHLGDVRLQNCPSPEGQDVLYFTAQWEHDGGGVYDVAKFTEPEVIAIPLQSLPGMCSVSLRSLLLTALSTSHQQT